jgi:hypothetical protein
MSDETIDEEALKRGIAAMTPDERAAFRAELHAMQRDLDEDGFDQRHADFTRRHAEWREWSDAHRKGKAEQQVRDIEEKALAEANAIRRQAGIKEKTP